MNDIFLTGAGVVSHAGRGLMALHEGLLKPDVQPEYRLLEEVTPAVTVPYLPARIATAGNRVMGLVEAAIVDALTPFAAEQRRNMSLFIASSTADLLGNEPAYAQAIGRGESALPWCDSGAGLLATRVAQQFGLFGAQFTINTACSSGVHALLYAAAAIRRGECERALVVGLECPGRVTLAGFNALLLVTRTQCRPFDRNRDGLMLGEAAAAIVLEPRATGPEFSGMRLLGGATACDPGNISQTHAATVDGLMRAGMRNAGIECVDAVKAHGTGTQGNDSAEAAGIAACVDARRVPVTSLKPAVGHTLGACGVLETLAMAVCWREGHLPPTTGFQTPDPALDLEPASRVRPLPPGRMLLNYFGFGGNNGVLVLEYEP